METLIGAGGWAYFQVPRIDSLQAYSSAFNFVEVNSTFYEIPSLELVDSWRRRVVPNFEFAVRCHKDITHKYQMEPNEATLGTFRIMKCICEALRSRYLVLETPPTLNFNIEKLESVREIFANVDLKGLRIVWEIRRKRGKPIPSSLIALMHDYNMIHCVDFSKEDILLESDAVYTRIFGKGENNIYQFTDEELVEIDRKITKKNPETAVLSFHNVRMYKDAARYKIHKLTGSFPPATASEGLLSLREVLVEDTNFPITRQELIKHQGWKIVDLTGKKKIRATSLLEKLPDRIFRNVNEILDCLSETNPIHNSDNVEAK